MTGSELFAGYWWVIPAIMFFLCFFFMKRCATGGWCGFGEYYERKESALDILDKRYARGEIDQAEYEEKKKRLAHSPTRTH